LRARRVAVDTAGRCIRLSTEATVVARGKRVTNAERDVRAARAILRHVRAIDTKQGWREWSKAVLGEFRSGHKSAREARLRRELAADMIEYLDAAQEQQRLVEAYSGLDIDSPHYRKAAALRVGLRIPEAAPLEGVADVRAKYDVSGKLGTARGIAGLRAQLFGTTNPEDAKK
jgi:hypothetical protein